MKVWIVVGALDGKIDEAAVFLQEARAFICEQKMREYYSYPEKISNDVALFEREI